MTKVDVDNNILNKLEEKKSDIAICHDQYSLSLSENTIYKGDRSIGSNNISRCEIWTDVLMNCRSPNN